MSGYKYFVILTDIGKQKLAQAIATESPLDFTEMAVGDSNGTSYNPTPDMTALKHETYRATISNVSIDEVDKNIMIFQLVVPSSSGGYYIREAGLFSSDGSLIAIARTAEQYKPQLSEGAGASIDINMRIAISSEAQIYINVPESDSYATNKYVAEEFKKHTQEEDPHQQYMLETYANEIFATKESVTTGLDAKADKKHNHDEVYVKKADKVNLPVGFIYFQLRSQDTPDVVFGTSGKWQDISSTYAGEFFRAAGGASASFGSKQNEGLPDILGYFNNVIGAQNTANGALFVENVGETYFAGQTSITSFVTKSLGLNASKSNTIYGASTHVTPYNSAIRIWKKIS